jgi:hypothetical protein
VNARRVLPLGVGVALLVALAGIASHGRPLSGGRGPGPTATFFDYVATSLVIFAFVILGVVVYVLAGHKVHAARPRRGRWNLVTLMLSFFAALVIVWVLSRTGFINRLQKLEHNLANGRQSPGKPVHLKAAGKNVRNPHLRWDELVVFIALIAAGVLVYVSRLTNRAPKPWRFDRREDVSLAIDESIEDLRNDPNLRRAIVAAYARMEHALGRAGLPRHPSEAPFEYVERALGSLETSSDSAQRLTTLFERAKFSHHEPAPEMRNEAIDALVAVRDELARPVVEPVTA